MAEDLQYKNKAKKTVVLFMFIIGLVFIFLVVVFFIIYNEKRRIPTQEITRNELAVRGDIVSSDSFTLATSKKIYKAYIDTRFLDPQKLELFVKLFSIYSNIPQQNIYMKLKNQKTKGNLVLSHDIDSKTAKDLKELGFKLRRLGVFQSQMINGSKLIIGLSVDEIGEDRIYSYEETLTPALGYITKTLENDKRRVNGGKGVEFIYNEFLNDFKDGILKGSRDVLSYISFDKNSVIKERLDGATIELTIPLKLQKHIEMVVDQHQERLLAQEILVVVMDNKTGQLLTIATTNRYNPNNIQTDDYEKLNIKATEFPFEPGSVLKPIVISMAMDKNRVRMNESFSAYNRGSTNSKGEYPKGSIKIGQYTITDDHQFTKQQLSVEDIVTYSSNIGTLQIAQRLSGREFYNDLVKFGFNQPTGIDLPFEKTGIVPSVARLSAGEARGEDNIYKATVSYGHGMTATIMQLIKAYSAFSNEGKVITPQIMKSITSSTGVKYINKKKDDVQVISPKTAAVMRDLLIKTVEHGTGKRAYMEGLQIGGKTGTARMPDAGKYTKEYISSFFGFVNDYSGNSYTIGVTTLRPKGTAWYHYYASEAAVPVFRETTQTLINLGYLKPKN
ncbi:MAG: penicillin-binding protein 2 [Arcobacteraceae bacterium]|jgi:cell division protein FtsI (penicillin-binding protein 3)|nr:penicillin-binding protein 2 [Arcobacteraceae bacterium]